MHDATTMKIVKLQRNNDSHSDYIHMVLKAMQEQHQQSHGHDIDIEQTMQYCWSNVYCMIDNHNNLVGFFSLSRFDFAIKSWLISVLMFVYNIIFGRIFVYDVYVFPKFRKLGLGKTMMSLLITHVKEQFCFINSICLHAASKSLVPFYHKCGFHLVGVHSSTIYMHYDITS